MKKVYLILTAIMLFAGSFAAAQVITSFENLRDGQKCRLTGKVFQIVEDEGFLFTIKENYVSNNVFVKSATGSFFEGQKLTVEGKMEGTFSYTTIMEMGTTIPYIIPENIK